MLIMNMNFEHDFIFAAIFSFCDRVHCLGGLQSDVSKLGIQPRF